MTHNNDVPERRWLLLDFDRMKTESDKRLSATDAEKAVARELAQRTAVRMAELGWAAPLVIDSGNGFHHYRRIAAPLPGGKVDDSAADPLAVLLRLLAAELNTPQANIDTSVFNSSRVMKLPDMVARKGVPTADRPHRPCVVLNVPTGWSPTEPDPGADVAATIDRLDP